MQLKKSSLHYWIWAWTFRCVNKAVPETTSLCPYFWRVVLLAPFRVLEIMLFCAMALGMLYGIVAILIPFVAVHVANGVVWLVMHLHWFIGGGLAVWALVMSSKFGREVAGPYAKARYRRLCPLVTFVA